MAHDPTVPHKHEQIAAPDLTGWTGEIDDGDVSVSGPCPACQGAAYGPTLLQVEEEPSVTLLLAGDGDIDNPDVRAACDCKSDHGKVGATNCGRYWFVRVVTGP